MIGILFYEWVPNKVRGMSFIIYYPVEEILFLNDTCSILPYTYFKAILPWNRQPMNNNVSWSHLL